MVMLSTCGRSRVLGFSPHPGRFGPFRFALRSFTPLGEREGQLFLPFLPHFTHEIRFLLTTPIVQAFAPSPELLLRIPIVSAYGQNTRLCPMPSADFCPAVRSPLGSLSRVATTQDRPPGVIPAAFHAQSPDLHFPFLMNMDFAKDRLLVQRWCLISGFCSSTRAFAPRFFRTLRRQNALALR